MNNNRDVLVITPCTVPLGNGAICGSPPVAVDLGAGRFVCRTHLALVRSYTADELTADDAITQAYAVLRSNDEHLRELREQGQ
jgi:hypothetical protein